MRRSIEAQLLAWQQSSPRKPLIVRGARQVGKTWTIRQFGRERFRAVASIDLERDFALRSVFEGSLAADGLVRQIEAVCNVSLSGGQTLLFLDEIQAVPRAITALRYLYEERPDIPVIAAGSALEFAFGDLSFPVGRVTFAWMRPMTFEEFLRASGQERLADALPRLAGPGALPAALHERVMDELRAYLIVGGMPEAVARFLDTGSFEAARSVHSDLAVSLAESLVKYNARMDVASASTVFHQLPRMVGRQVRYAHLDPDRRIEKTRASLQALARACLHHPVYAVDAHALPLGASLHEKRFKSVFLDVGLMQFLLGVTPREVLTTRDFGAIHQGAVAEQLLGQELLAAGGTENDQIYYWTRADQGGNAEVDYLLARGGTVFPLEVKSGAAGRLRSLRRFLDEHPSTPLGIVFSPIAREKRQVGQILFVPLYTRLEGTPGPSP